MGSGDRGKGERSKDPKDNKPREVFEKPGEQEENRRSLKRKSEDDSSRQQQKLASMKSKIDAISKSAEKIKTEKLDGDKKSKAAKVAPAAAAAAAGLPADKGRREELLKQLRAVEEAIHRKRSKLDK